MIRRRTLSTAESKSAQCATGEFTATGQKEVTIYHGLGTAPKVFALYTDDEVTEEKGVINSVLLNSGKQTRYTSAVSKAWTEYYAVALSDGVNDAACLQLSSALYGVQSIDAEKIVIDQPGYGQVFLDGKTYKWIAIAI